MWYLCIQQLEWITEQKMLHPAMTIGDLKEKWSEKYGFNVNSNCFFCYYNCNHRSSHGCNKCPGKLVDPTFSCRKPKYHYTYNSFKFYAKLLELEKLLKD